MTEPLPKRPGERRRDRLVAAGLSVAVAFLLVSALGRVWAPADSLNILAPYWWPAVLCAVAMAAWEWRGHVLGLLPLPILAFTLAMGAVLFGPLIHMLTYPSHRPAPGTRAISVISYNFYKDNARAAADAAWLIEQDADILILLEASRVHGAAGAALRAKYPVTVDCSPDYDCSTLVLSKLPLISQRRLANGDAEDRKALSALIARFDVDGRPLSVLALHQSRPWPLGNQPRWTAELNEATASLTGAAVMAGDFNSAPWTFATRRIAASGHFRLATGLATSWPAGQPALVRLPLDQLYLRGPVAAAALHTGPRLGSDHLPLIATIVQLPSGR